MFNEFISVDEMGDGVTGIYGSVQFPNLYSKLWSFVPKHGTVLLSSVWSEFSLRERVYMEEKYNEDYNS